MSQFLQIKQLLKWSNTTYRMLSKKIIKDYLKEQILKYLGYIFKKHITNMNCTPVYSSHWCYTWISRDTTSTNSNCISITNLDSFTEIKGTPSHFTTIFGDVAIGPNLWIIVLSAVGLCSSWSSQGECCYQQSCYPLFKKHMHHCTAMTQVGDEHLVHIMNGVLAKQKHIVWGTYCWWKKSFTSWYGKR